jgi:hypothetical protein
MRNTASHRGKKHAANTARIMPARAKMNPAMAGPVQALHDSGILPSMCGGMKSGEI